ncbi:MAG: ferrous iron transport protein B [Caldilinea sp.]
MTASCQDRTPPCFRYAADIESEIDYLCAAIDSVPALAAAYNARWLAVQLLEGDESIKERVHRCPGAEAVSGALATSRARLRPTYGDDIDVALVDRRYEFVHQVVSRAVVNRTTHRLSRSDQIDCVVTHPVWGVPIFLALMWLVFKVTIDVSAPYLDWIDQVVNGPVANQLVALLGALGLSGGWLESLLVDGVLAGVGGVLVFIPVMFALYLVLAMLEDCGYMARAAMVMDRPMRKIGLQGKSFLPMVVGFGCSVPAIYATRTLENHRDRLLTGLLAPFMSCSARLPVYVLFAAIFFPQHASLAIFMMYLLGIVVAILVGLLLNRTLLRTNEPSHFIMELPPYRLPIARNIWRQMWERTAAFIRNAWTIILTVSIVLWILLAIPLHGEGNAFGDAPVEDSLFGGVAGAVAPAFAPLGFGSWQASGALITGFVAKEVVVATLAQVYRVELPEAESTPTTLLEDALFVVTSFGQATIDTAKSIPLIFGINLFGDEEDAASTALMTAVQASFDASSGGHGALAGLAFMVFVLLYTPCMAAVAASRHEFGVKWMWVSVLGQFVIAWLAALLVFQLGRLALG